MTDSEARSLQEVVAFCECWIEHLDASIAQLRDHLEQPSEPADDATRLARTFEYGRMQAKRRAMRSVWEFATGRRWPRSNIREA